MAGRQGVLWASLHDGPLRGPGVPVAGGGHVESCRLAVEAAIGHQVAAWGVDHAGGLDAVLVAVAREPRVDRDAEPCPTPAGSPDRRREPAGDTVVLGVPHAQRARLLLEHPGAQCANGVRLDRPPPREDLSRSDPLHGLHLPVSGSMTCRGTDPDDGLRLPPVDWLLGNPVAVGEAPLVGVVARQPRPALLGRAGPVLTE